MLGNYLNVPQEKMFLIKFYIVLCIGIQHSDMVRSISQANTFNEKMNEEKIEAEKVLKEAEASGDTKKISSARKLLNTVLDKIKSTATESVECTLVKSI